MSADGAGRFALLFFATAPRAPVAIPAEEVSFEELLTLFIFS